MQDPFTKALDGLPHGPEFRFLDTLTSLDPGQRGAGTYEVRGDEDFLAGHFPGRPIMPGVILVEAVAQLAGVVVAGDPDFPADAEGGLLLTAVRGAKITGAASPGDVLEIRAELEGSLGGLYQCAGSVDVDGRTILTTKVTLSLAR